jgi:1,4-dihydroxy-2-naphthoyl-CoA synthase
MSVDSSETVVETVVNTLAPSEIVWSKIDSRIAMIGVNRLQRRGVFIPWCVVEVADGSNEASTEWYP